MRRTLRLAVIGAALLASPAWARPVSPRSGGFEVGGSGFLAEQVSAGGSDVVAGPQLHLAVRLPAADNILIGFMGRLGASVGRQAGSVSMIALEGRLMLGDLDLAPYASVGLGVLFRTVRDEVNLSELAQRPDAALPAGLGIETRLTDTLMLGFAVRYTLVLSDLDRTTGPVDAAIYLVFL